MTGLSSPDAKRQPQLAGVFETPVIIEEIAQAERLNTALKTAILERQHEDEGLRISNIGGWHSDTKMLDWGGEAARALSGRIIALADKFTKDIKAGGGRRHVWAPEMWANVSPPGSSNRHHCHPGAYWSAVYYVEDGYAGSSDRKLGGELVLFDPRMPMIRMTAPDLRFERPDGSVDHDEVALRPASGRVVMFPSWLNHAVRPYNGSGVRISVAVNLTAVAAPPQPRSETQGAQMRPAYSYKVSSDTSR